MVAKFPTRRSDLYESGIPFSPLNWREKKEVGNVYEDHGEGLMVRGRAKEKESGSRGRSR